MPRTLSFPPPSTATCPICAAPLGGPHCDGCGATFTGPDGATLWRVDHDLFDLCQIRNDLVRRLLPPTPTPADPRPAAAPSPASPAPWSAPAAGARPASVRAARSVDPAGPPTGAVAPPTVPPGAARLGGAPVSAAAGGTRASGPDGAGGRQGAAAATGHRSPGPGPGDGPDRAPAPPPPPRGGAASGRRPRPSFTAAELLVGLGALSLVAAVAVFAAVAWSDLAAWAQGGLIVGLTGVVLAAAAACRRRQLGATAESLGAVAVALGLADVQVARVALDGAASSRTVWAVGVGVVAAGAIALGRCTGIRVLGLAGGALAFAPLVVATGGARPLLAAAALAAQAVAAAALAARLPHRPIDPPVDAASAALPAARPVRSAVHPASADPRPDRPVGPASAAFPPGRPVGPAAGDGPVDRSVADRRADRRLERAVVATGAALSWCGAVGTALVLAAAGLGAEPTAHAVGPALVLAALAAATIVTARTTPSRTCDTEPGRPGLGAAGSVAGGCGTALAFVPGVLLVLGTGSIVGVLAVLAAQGVLALVLDPLTPGERLVARAGGVLSWTVAAVGLVALAGLELADGAPATEPVAAALVLAGQAAATIVAARTASSRTGDTEPGGPEPGVAGSATTMVGGAGTALALVPAALLAAATGSPLAVVVVLAAQAIAALALRSRTAESTVARGSTGAGPAPPSGPAGPAWASTGASRTVEPSWLVLHVGGAASWVAAVAGALALVPAEPIAAPLVLAALAAASVALARRTDDATLGAAGVGLAFLPAVLLAGTSTPLAVVAVVAAQAVVALAVVGGLRPAERVVAVVGGAACWAAAVAGGVALTSARPLGAPLVLAGLAAVSMALARRADDDVATPLGVGGSALVLAPALLVALTSGAPLAVVAVGAGQAVLALALAGATRAGRPVLTEVERGVAHGFGRALWVGSAVGSLVLAVVEVAGALADPDPRIGSLLVLALLAIGSIGAGSATRQTALTAAGAGVAFVPVPLLVAGVTTPSVLIAVLGAEAVAAAVLHTVVGRGPTRAVLAAGGVTSWATAVVGAGLLGAVGWMGGPVVGPAGSVALLLGLALVAAGASLGGGWHREAAAIGLGAAVVPVLAAVGVAAGGLGVEGWTSALLVATGALAVGAGLRQRVDPDRPWAAPALVALSVGAVAAVVPGRAVVAVVAALGEQAVTAPDVGAGATLADWLRPSLAASGLPVPGWATVAQLVGVTGLAGGLGLRQRGAGRVAGTVLAVAALAVVPVATGLTVALTVGGVGAVLAALGLVVRHRPRDPELLAAGIAVVALGTAVAVASAPWAVWWTVLVGLVVGGLATEAGVRRSPDTPTWVGGAIALAVGGVALDAWVLGADHVDGLLAVAVAAAAVSPVAAVLDRRGQAGAAEVVDVLVALVLAAAVLVAPAVTGTLLSLSPFVALVGVTAAGVALRPRRRSAWVVAAASAVVLAWLEAGRAEVELVEAYTLPLAAWALAVGAVAGRPGAMSDAWGSWARFGVGLLAAAGPTTVLSLVDADPWRTVAVVAGCSALAVWGAAARLQAPLAIGAAGVGALAVRHLGPVGVELPRYVAFAVAGLVLLAVGATFEQRRQDLRHARDAFVRLR